MSNDHRAMTHQPARGLLFIISAASGTGKTTLAERLVQILPNLRMSRSYTSRPARAGERDGVDYNFVSRADFDGMIERGEFLEWADVFGNLYGTSRPDAERLQESGQDVVLVIDVQGAAQVKRSGIDHTSIFVLPPSFEILERRLRGRSADSEAAMQRRLAAARAEAGCYVDYDYVVINDQLGRRWCGCRKSSPPNGRGCTGCGRWRKISSRPSEKPIIGKTWRS
jgi:guanylate kinase